jgi:hypothetical protein
MLLDGGTDPFVEATFSEGRERVLPDASDIDPGRASHHGSVLSQGSAVQEVRIDRRDIRGVAAS